MNLIAFCLLFGAFLCLILVGQTTQAANLLAGSGNGNSSNGKLKRASQQVVSEDPFGAPAPFYSIKDSKTSARRIQKTNPASASATDLASKTNSGGSKKSLNKNSINSPAGRPLGRAQSMDVVQTANRQQVEDLQEVSTATTTTVRPTTAASDMNNNDNERQNDKSDAVSDANVATDQQQMMIDSFNQLADNLMLSNGGGDAQPTVEGSAVGQQQSNSEANSEAIDSTGAGQAKVRPNKQTNQTPSSLSMSLDEMIVNSRPRATNSDVGANNNGNGIGNGNSKRPPAQKQSNTQSSKATKSISNKWPKQVANAAEVINEPNKIQDDDAPNRDSNNNPINLANSSNQPTRRVGDQIAPGNQQANDMNGNNQTTRLINAKASRRVPFTGVPFSSPASKGQRTKPKASNQFGLSSQSNGNQFDDGRQQAADLNGLAQGNFNQAGTSLPALMAPIQQAGELFNEPQDRPTINQQATNMNFNPNQRPQQQQFIVQSSSFDEPIEMTNNNQQLPSSLSANDQSSQVMQMFIGDGTTAANMQLMDNNVDDQLKVANNNGTGSRQQTLMQRAQATKLANGDMLMSIVDSDGNNGERRLVMISRDTLNSLQRFASQQLQQQQSPLTTRRPNGSSSSSSSSSSAGIKGNKRTQQNRPTFQTDSSLITGPANSWWPPASSTPTSTSSTTTTTTANNLPQTTQSADSTPSRPTIDNEQREEVQLQTSTLAPGRLAAVTTTTTIAPTSPASNFAQQVTTTTTRGDASSSTVGPAESTGGPNLQPNNEQSSSGSSSSRESDSFREVSVPTSSAAPTADVPPNKQTSTKSSGKRPSSSGSGSGGKQSTRNKSSQAGSSSTTLATSVASKKPTNGQLNKSNGSNAGNKSSSAAKQQQVAKTSAGKATTSGATSKKQNNGTGNKPKSSGGKTSNGTKSNTKKTASNESSAQTAGGGQTNQPTTVTTTASPRQRLSGQAESTTSGSSLQTTGGTSTTTSSIESTTTPGVEFVALSGDQNKQPKGQSSNNQTTFLIGQLNGLSKMELDKKLDEIENNGSSEGNSGGQESSVSSADGQQNQPSARTSNQRRPSQGQQQQQQQTMVNELEGLRAAIPGEPIADYPIYGSPPRTSFDCRAQSCPGGYYADVESQCQVFHICQNDGRSDTFLCPNGTIFSQQHFVCVWWWQVDCQQSPQFYKINDGIYCNSMSLPSGRAVESQTSTGDNRTGLPGGQSSGNNSNDDLPETRGTSSSAVVGTGSSTLAPSSGSTTQPKQETFTSTDTEQPKQTENANENNNNNRKPTSSETNLANEQELNQQQQQQLELLSRRA